MRSPTWHSDLTLLWYWPQDSQAFMLLSYLPSATLPNQSLGYFHQSSLSLSLSFGIRNASESDGSLSLLQLPPYFLSSISSNKNPCILPTSSLYQLLKDPDTLLKNFPKFSSMFYVMIHKVRIPNGLTLPVGRILNGISSCPLYTDGESAWEKSPCWYMGIV